MEDKFSVIYHNVTHGLNLETSKTFFLRIFHTARPCIKVFVGIQIQIRENTLHFLKCQGIKNCFQTKTIFPIRKNDNDQDTGHLKKKIVTPLVIKCFLLFSFQEVTSSVAMEKEGFTRCMLDILNVLDLPIRVVSTDKYVSIKKLMKTDERFRHIFHQFDIWHVEESILKTIMKASQKQFFFILLANLLYILWLCLKV